MEFFGDGLMDEMFEDPNQQCYQQYPLQLQDQQHHNAVQDQPHQNDLEQQQNGFDQQYNGFDQAALIQPFPDEQQRMFGPPEDFVGTSGSDPIELAAAGEHDLGNYSSTDTTSTTRRKHYHRHTSYQIQRLEDYFSECQHPDDKQRRDLSRELGLGHLQIKFWFQNKRTQVKSLNERMENLRLKEENERLAAENSQIKELLNSSFCQNCGSSRAPVEAPFEIDRLGIAPATYTAQTVASAAYQNFTAGSSSRAAMEFGLRGAQAGGLQIGAQAVVPQIGAQAVGLHIGAQASGVQMGAQFSGLQIGAQAAGLQFGAQAAGLQIGAQAGFAAVEAPRPADSHLEIDRGFLQELAVAAMLEVIEVSQIAEPLWSLSSDGTTPVLNEEEYARRFSGGLGPKAPEMNTEISRAAGIFNMNAERMIQVLMDANNWTTFFSTIVSRSTTVKVYSQGSDGSQDGALQLMTAELQVPSPLVPLREGLFLRYCKKQEADIWVVVDVSLEVRQNSSISFRRRPSGCLIQELGQGFTKVIWLEHVEADNREVHDRYKPLVSSGFVFGAKRWIATLTRQCRRLSSLLVMNNAANDIGNPQARKSILKIAERMVVSYCSGVSGSVAHEWIPITWNGEDQNMKIRSRKSNGVLGRPPGIVLNASTSLWLPVPPKMIYDLLLNETGRKEWDILLQGSSISQTVHVLNGPDQDTRVSMAYVADTARGNNMAILQETCYDPILTYLIYAPINPETLNTVLTSGDLDGIPMMPSGFAILPDGINGAGTGGSLLTIAYQILADSSRDGNINPISVKTISDLVISTAGHIRRTLVGEQAEPDQ